jgi:hypothetical protein
MRRVWRSSTFERLKDLAKSIRHRLVDEVEGNDVVRVRRGEYSCMKEGGLVYQVEVEELVRPGMSSYDWE